jgi:hypothetical protein
MFHFKFYATIQAYKLGEVLSQQPSDRMDIMEDHKSESPMVLVRRLCLFVRQLQPSLFYLSIPVERAAQIMLIPILGDTTDKDLLCL